MIASGVRAPLCHPALAPRVSGYRAWCPACGSFWDLESLDAASRYTQAYPAERSHFDARLGELKVATLERWLEATRLVVTGRVACEVGFGGGHCLARLHATARRAFGIEAIAASIDHAAGLGVPRGALFCADRLPDHLPEPVDLWLFQDALEHLLDPDPFLAWLARNSAGGSRALVVARDASSGSRRLLGRLWPHRVPDHAFHWSPAGLDALFGRHGFAPVVAFRPVKRVSGRMLLLHLRQTRLAPLSHAFERVVPAFDLWFNVGEMGRVFARN